MSVEFSGTESVEYDVHGRTLEDVAAVIAEMAEAGRAEWFPHYGYDHDGHTITSAAVTVATRVTLPRWNERDSASPGEQREWDRFREALAAHEQGHFNLVWQHLGAVDEHLVGRSPDNAAAAWRHVLAELDVASDAYDASTDHGRTSGTVIDLDAVMTS